MKRNVTANLSGVNIRAILILVFLLVINRGLDKIEDLFKKIEQLKKEKDAVILAHYYTNDEVQSIADYVGDSYFLSKIAAEAQQKVIVFCGVSFMGESAKILNPEKTVIMPDRTADCPMAHMVSPENIADVREGYEDLAVVCYINSTAEIKTHADVCVTSSNALRITRALPQKNIYFIPDGNLGRYVARLVPEKNFIFNEGFCHVHAEIMKKDVENAKVDHPNAKVLAHPECKLDVLDLADYVGSTSGIIDYANANEANEFIICTEIGILYELKKRNPNKVFYTAKPDQICPDMKMITLDKIADALENMNNQVEIDAPIRVKAAKSLEKMLELSK